MGPSERERSGVFFNDNSETGQYSWLRKKEEVISDEKRQQRRVKYRKFLQKHFDERRSHEQLMNGGTP